MTNEELTKIREDRKETKSEFAKHLGITPMMMGRYESGKIKIPDAIAEKAKELSGGNQQKICLAKAFALEPKFLFVSEPTRGIDVGAKALVLNALKKFNRESGVTVVMISSELEELRQKILPYYEQEEDILSYALFEQVAIKFFEARKAKKYGIDATSADAALGVHSV